jgi:hypothetical protein
LTNITVFDGRCARVITDDRNEISYLPYGADVFQKTAEAGAAFGVLREPVCSPPDFCFLKC